MAEDGRLGYGDGSSPLARGLPAVRGVEDGSIRIIPARAGFTGVGFIVRFLSGDHPRSRGVYHKDTVECIWMIGSSPLARGLPRPVSESIRFRRIIPARAGFTLGACRSSVRVWDHPRSRGVYIQTTQLGLF